MKENNFYSDDFEQLIRGKTEQYKMYPSENVWKGVHNALHTKRKWFIGSMAFLVTGILFLAGKELISPSHTALHKTTAVAGSEVSKPSIAEEKAPVAPMAVLRSSASVAVSTRHSTTFDDGIIDEGQDASYTGINITVSHPVLSQSDLSEWLSHVVKLPEQAPDLTRDLAAIDTRSTQASHNGTTSTSAETPGNTPVQTPTTDDETTNGLSARSVLESLNAKSAENAYTRTGRQSGQLAGTRSNRSTVTGQDQLPGSAGTSAKGIASATAIAEADDRQRINWLHDYAMNILDATPRSGRTFLQFTLAPTINYRSMGGSDPAATKFMQAGSTPFAAHMGSPNDFVSHKPGIGFEFGANVLYRLTRNFSIKGGLQFNFIRYTIQAYATNRPQQQTTTLNTYYGYYMDSISSINTLAATAYPGSSKSVQTLDNDYYQLSAPIGFELRVLGNERLQFNLGGTIQPSYLLNTGTYMLTSGYTDYTKQPSWARRWNVSAGLEAFLSYRMGNIRWQAGPEFRYQLQSSYLPQYPITENLKGYGFKIGITKPLP